MIKTNKGFTLIELLVVVLIIGILAAMAMPQYFKAVERSRMTEADTLLGSIAQAQRRKFLQRNKFTKDYRGLDVSPKGATGSAYQTKANGFNVVLDGENFTEGKATATRTAATGSTLQYAYNLVRYYQSDNVTCEGTNTAGQELCADFCGIDAPQGKCCNDGDAAKTDGCPAPTSN